MGGSETDTKGPKTSDAQEHPPATSSSPSAAVYPDWSGFQAYSPIPPHGFFHSPVVSSPQGHPYMWGAQHLMPPYGTPPPPYVMYPHGIYAHPSVPPGSHPFSPYAMSSPNGNTEAYGNFPASAEGDRKSSEGKEKPSLQRSKGSLGSLNLITGKSNELEKTSSALNGAFSQSGDSGSEDSSEGSDANSQNMNASSSDIPSVDMCALSCCLTRDDSGLKTGGRQELLDEKSRNGTSSVAAAPVKGISHKTMSLMPVLPAGVPGGIAGPTTNLNIGMDYWVAPTSTAIPLVHGKISATAAAGAMISGTLVGTDEKVPTEIWLQDERELKRQRRKQSNRESARRSRLRKQAEYEELAQRVEVLREENSALRAELVRIKEEHDELLAQNASLKEKAGEIIKEEESKLEDSNRNAEDKTD